MWPTYPNDGPFPSQPGNGSYDWQDASVAKQGTRSLTNGTLWSYVKAKDVYLCPTFAQWDVCKSRSPVRSYAMNSSLSYANILSVTSPVTTILFGDSRDIRTAVTNSQFAGLTEIGRWHSSTSGVGGGNVVYLDGHVEKR
jgi:prepilin-type processing-associated H-X9-DG protein